MRVVVEVALPSLLAVKLLMLAMVVAVVADHRLKPDKEELK
jgi:hypothetical protein